MAQDTSAAQNGELENTIKAYAALPETELYRALGSSQEGLAANTAATRLRIDGPNEITHGKTTSWFVRLLFSFANPFNLVLALVALVSLFTEVILVKQQSWDTVIVISLMIGISGILQFVQESSSNKAAEELKKMVSSTADLLRDGAFLDLPMKDIVKGDLIKLSAGDMIPADVRILSAKDLFIAQSALTGESEPVEKFARLIDENASALGATNICYMGTNVVSGTAIAIALQTGNWTYFGRIAKDLTGERAKSSFEKGVGEVSHLLLRLMSAMVPVIFLANGLLKDDWLSALLFSLSMAVGLTPELLPLIMTSTLAKGTVAMAKKKTIVKHLSSIQSFGAMDVLCTDKTGTLTEDRIVLERYLDIYGEEDLHVLKRAYLNSFFQTGLKNLIDVAIIARAEKEGYSCWNSLYKKVDEIPFDFTRRRMSVVLEDQQDQRFLITKGAVEEMLTCCAYVYRQGDILPLDGQIRTDTLAVADLLNEQGLRVLAIAQKNEVHDVHVFGVADESDMVLLGYVGFLDPPKQSCREAITALREHGVRVVVLTGDNEKVAANVCRQVGISADPYLLGTDVDAMDDATLRTKSETTDLFAKLSPREKMRVVHALQSSGHTVGYMGDGINDAPALHQSDIGISVDSAVDIAKESADIILLEKSLMVLEDGVVEGRKTFGNLVKYIKMASSGNFGNMFSVLLASVFLPFLPMLPIQILAQNLLYDFSQIAIPFDHMYEEYLKKPQKWDAADIKRFMYWFGPLSSLFDIITFLVLFYIFKANSIEKQATFQTGWFMVGLITQTLIVHLIRTNKIPFIASVAARPLVLSTIAISALALAIPYTIIGVGLDMVPMPPAFFPAIVLILLAYAVMVQFLKNIYIQKYGRWL